jgi:hypothetical protein
MDYAARDQHLEIAALGQPVLEATVDDGLF